MKDVYNELFETSLKLGDVKLKHHLDEYQFQDYFIDYYKGARTYFDGVS